jgi:hypothetical protein
LIAACAYAASAKGLFFLKIAFGRHSRLRVSCVASGHPFLLVFTVDSTTPSAKDF